MTAAAGLLGYLSPMPLSDRVREAVSRSSWRGAARDERQTARGAIVALGCVQLGAFGDVSVAVHGRFDNLLELAAEVAGPAEPCAVAAELYRRHGDEFAGRLLGDFACLVLDNQRGALLGARDWIGARPLYWGRHGDVVAFASEVKQVLALLGLPRRLDEETLAAFQTRTEPSPGATFVLGVHAVEANGQVLALAGGQDRSWRRPLRFLPNRLRGQEAIDAVRNALETAVERRACDAQKLGSQLSGGLDSTTVVAIASSLAKRGQGPPVTAAFTMSFPDVPETDETGRARDVAERWQVPWTIVNVRPAEILENLGEIFAVHDGPVFPSFISQLKLMEAAGADVDVIFTGHGGDDWLRQGDQELRLSVMRADWKGVAQWGWWQGRWMGNAGRRRVINAVVQGAAGRVRGQRAESWFEQTAASFWTRHALELTEREGMRRGLRVEFPLHDAQLAALLAGLTPSLRSQPRIAKYILREATRDLLPESVLNYFEWTLLDPVLRVALGDDGNHAGISDEILRRYAAKWRTMAAD